MLADDVSEEGRVYWYAIEDGAGFESVLAGLGEGFPLFHMPVFR